MRRSPTPLYTHFILIALVCVSALTAASCSPLLGWGVILWDADKSGPETGAVVPVHIKSKIDEVWVVGYTAPDSKKRVKLELPLWQLEFLGSKSKAAAFAASYAEWVPFYAETLLDGLPMRSAPDNNAPRTYRLREGQIVKVIAKVEGTPVMSGANPLPGDWLRVLTEDGSSGYSFSYRLRVFRDDAGEAFAQNSTADEAEELGMRLAELFAEPWYPESYRSMLDTRRVDLASLTSDHGLFLTPDRRQIRVVLPGRDLSIGFSKAAVSAEGQWTFEGSSLELQRLNPTTLQMKHTESGGAQRTYVFVNLPMTPAEIIEAETARRRALYQAIFTRGPVFRSEGFGELRLQADRSFSWNGFSSLAPMIFPADFNGTGTVAFPLFLDPPLDSRWDGALNLEYLAGGKKAVASFLYKFERDGLKLEYLPPASIENLVVKQRDKSPTVLFFAPEKD